MVGYDSDWLSYDLIRRNTVDVSRKSPTCYDSTTLPVRGSLRKRSGEVVRGFLGVAAGVLRRQSEARIADGAYRRL